jgi:hypothetical protein
MVLQGICSDASERATPLAAVRRISITDYREVDWQPSVRSHARAQRFHLCREDTASTQRGELMLIYYYMLALLMAAWILVDRVEL